MNKVLKTSLCIILIGFILSVIGFLTGGRFREISVTTNGVKVYNINKDKNIVKESFNLDSFNKVNILSSFDLSYIEVVKGDKYKVDFQYDKENKIDYSVKDGELTISYNSKEEKNIINFGFFNNNLEEGIKLYVPEDCNLDELKINTSSSDIKVDKVNGKNIDINNEYGDIDLLNSSYENIVLKASSGDINLSEIRQYISPLINSLKDEELAKRFDLLMYTIELSSLQRMNVKRYIRNVIETADKLSKLGTIPEIQEKLKSFHKSFRDLWYKECKGQGFEVIDIRLGGVMARCGSAMYRIKDYLKGNIDNIEELEEERLYFSEHFGGDDFKLICCNEYQKIATQNILSW